MNSIILSVAVVLLLAAVLLWAKERWMSDTIDFGEQVISKREFDDVDALESSLSQMNEMGFVDFFFKHKILLTKELGSGFAKIEARYNRRRAASVDDLFSMENADAMEVMLSRWKTHLFPSELDPLYVLLDQLKIKSKGREH